MLTAQYVVTVKELGNGFSYDIVKKEANGNVERIYSGGIQPATKEGKISPPSLLDIVENFKKDIETLTRGNYKKR